MNVCNCAYFLALRPLENHFIPWKTWIWPKFCRFCAFSKRKHGQKPNRTLKDQNSFFSVDHDGLDILTWGVWQSLAPVFRYLMSRLWEKEVIWTFWDKISNSLCRSQVWISGGCFKCSMMSSKSGYFARIVSRIVKWNCSKSIFFSCSLTKHHFYWIFMGTHRYWNTRNHFFIAKRPRKVSDRRIDENTK